MRAILTFHSIDDTGSVLSYPPKTFDKLLLALQSSAIPILDLDTLLRPETKTGVALTFDDGMRSVFTEALPILRNHSAPAHLFLTTDVVGMTNRWPSQPSAAPLYEMLHWREIEALQGAGIRVEAHTASHPDLRQLSDDALWAECDRADDTIASMLGARPRYFSYPYGFNDTRVRSFARERYVGSVTTDVRMLLQTEDPAALPRVETYYLRKEFLFRNLQSPATHGYIALRRVFRRFRTLG
ncbi:MAG TPA: polysaccharide deacetylase family protein [Pseudolabrys sp.]|nr:polysaccharide deacetylase family protein [Pseudolabrys sp.]